MENDIQEMEESEVRTESTVRAASKKKVYTPSRLIKELSFKADITAPKATIDNVEASKSFKSTNISDGIAVPGAPSSASLSQKIKEEAAPKSKSLKKN